MRLLKCQKLNKKDQSITFFQGKTVEIFLSEQKILGKIFWSGIEVEEYSRCRKFGEIREKHPKRLVIFPRKDILIILLPIYSIINDHFCRENKNVFSQYVFNNKLLQFNKQHTKF